MKRIILATATALLLTGCGHNLGTVVHGKFVNIGYDPEINKIGIQYVDGIMMTGVNKELSKNKLKFIDSAKKGDVETTTTLEYSGENGAQVTGYQVDLEKARQANAAQSQAAKSE
jgi:outer membrane lipopolysaccharide assembly protein LptE/RlpB